MYSQNNILKNISWIIICKFVQAILNLLISMYSARYLGPANFGLINYAASIVAFMLPIMQLGFRSTLVNELIQNPTEEGKTLGTALILNFCSAIICIFAIFVFVSVTNYNEKTTLIVCMLYSISLIFQAIEMIQYWFQAKLLSKYTALISLVVYFIVAIYKVFLLVTQKNIYWFAVSHAIDACLISIFLLVIYRKLKGQNLLFSFPRGKEMISKSKYYILSSMMVTIFAQTDKIMLKNMVSDEATGFYSVAVVCANMTSFIFAAIMDSIRPVILETKKTSIQDYRLYVSRLFSIIFYLSLLQCILMTLLAKPIIYILYGVKYIDAINVLRIVVWYTTFSYLGIVRNIWILAEEKQCYLWIINLFGALLNVGLNMGLIPSWGMIGAAFASVLTQFFTNFILGFIISPIKECNLLMMKGLHPRFAYNELKKLRKE